MGYFLNNIIILSIVVLGAYSVLYVKFHLRRHMGYFLINVYVPCALLVIISWVGFWINREATADRIALGTYIMWTYGKSYVAKITLFTLLLARVM